MKISFSLPNASSSKPNPIKPSTSLDDDQDNSDTLNDAAASIEYIHEFTADSDGDPTAPRVIPPIPNEWQPGGKKKIIIESEEESVLKEELKRLPEHRGVEEFAKNPVEGFGEALLAGYGWQPGRGIGKNATEDVGVVEFRANVGRKGLGFRPELID